MCDGYNPAVPCAVHFHSQEINHEFCQAGAGVGPMMTPSHGDTLLAIGGKQHGFQGEPSYGHAVGWTVVAVLRDQFGMTSWPMVIYQLV